MQPYEELEAWKRADDLAFAVFEATKAWPKEERFGLTAQIRRSVFSVAVNIVEGRAKRGRAEFRRFLDISWGSLAEVEYTLRFARRVGILDEPTFRQLEGLRDQTAKPLFGLLRAMSDS